MAETLGSLIVWVLRRTGQNPSKSALSDTDDTQWIADALDEAFQFIYSLKPFQVDVAGTITITPSTRLFEGPAGIDPAEIYDWSWRIDKAGAEPDVPLETATLQHMVEKHLDYEYVEADIPSLVYLERDQIGFFPLLTAGNDNLTAQFLYPALYSTPVWATTFLFPDDSKELLYAKKFAQYKYEVWKGLGMPDDTLNDVIDLKGSLKVKYARLKKQGTKGYRRFGR